MNNKFELTAECKEVLGHKLFRIRALVDIREDVKAGTLGGWVEDESNLGCDAGDNSWIYESGEVWGGGRVYNNSRVYNSRVDNSRVDNNSIVYNSIVDNSRVDNSRVYNNSIVYNSIVYNSRVDNSRVDNSRVDNNSIVYNSIVYNSRVDNNSIVYNSIVDNNSIVEKTSDVISISPIGSRNDRLTIIFSKKGLQVTTGCFSGTLKQFEAAVEKSHHDDQFGKDYQSAIVFIKALAESRVQKEGI